MNTTDMIEESGSDGIMEIAPITEQDIRNIMEDNYAPIVVLDWHGKDLVVRRYIPLSDFETVVETVVNASFDAKTGKYQPAYTDIMYRYSIILYYSNVVLPTNVEEAYTVLYGTDLFNLIRDNIDQGQRRDMQSAIGEFVRHRLAQETDFLRAKLNSFTDTLDRLQGIVDGVDKADMDRFIKAASNGVTLDEESIVKAYIDQRYTAKEDDF